jgi:hypothetical protein
MLAAQVGLLVPNMFYGNLGYYCTFVLQALVISTYRIMKDPVLGGDQNSAIIDQRESFPNADKRS